MLEKKFSQLPLFPKIQYNQYLNCNILHGGTLLQPWPNFYGNYVIPSPRPKQMSSTKLDVFFSGNKVESKKKGLHRNLGLYLAGICWIYSCWLALDRFIIQRLNFDGWASKGRIPREGLSSCLSIYFKHLLGIYSSPR